MAEMLREAAVALNDRIWAEFGQAGFGCQVR